MHGHLCGQVRYKRRCCFALKHTPWTSEFVLLCICHSTTQGLYFLLWNPNRFLVHIFIFLFFWIHKRTTVLFGIRDPKLAYFLVVLYSLFYPIQAIVMLPIPTSADIGIHSVYYCKLFICCCNLFICCCKPTIISNNCWI